MLEECFCRGYNENCDWCHGSGRKAVQLAKPVHPAALTRGNMRTARIRCGFCGKSVPDLPAHTQEQHPGQRPASWKETHPRNTPKARGITPVSAPAAQSKPAPPVKAAAAATPQPGKRGRKSRARAARSIVQIYEEMRERERKAAEERRREREARAQAMVRVTRPPATTRPAQKSAKSPAPAGSKPSKKIRFQGPLACPDCTRQVTDLRAHLMAEHGWVRNAGGGVKPPTDPKRTVPCPCCRTTSIRRDRLDQHLVRQHGIGDGERSSPSPAHVARVRAAAQGPSAKRIIHGGTPGDAGGRKPAASSPRQKEKRKSGAKAGTASTGRASSREREAYRTPAAREPGNHFDQERYERLSDATRGLGYARRESGHWGSTVAFDDYGDESHA